MSLPHPDVELYDNVGATTEQINAHRTNRPTADDLHRWAAHDAKDFTDTLTIEDAGQSITAWTDQLYRVRTTAQFQAVAQAVLGDGHSGLGELHQFLQTAAEWCEHNQEPDIAERYQRHAEQLSALGDQLSFVTDDHLAHTYQRTNPPAPARPVPSGPAVAPAPPAARPRRSSR
ncbi:hypothetical protein CTU88_14220 [Streptomyces sp. JV178]|uniref:hypothetical protein n=1 Tax=Streptomyces sp. JV178 TaxID=858632 RepID=UPI000C1B09C4|nr:hypothetical protein [Streptomyces sp. JV178]PIM71280.1 hypothetical protein CTU88_14220 [Streptomyces sp. JV178]